MCSLKVANQRGSGNIPASHHGSGGEEDDDSHEIESQLSHFRQVNNNPQMFYSYSRAGEMSAMVSALTRVVSGSGSGSGSGLGGEGQLTTSSGVGYGGAVASPSLTSSSSAGSGFWIGQKREREEDSLAESVQRVYRGFSHGDSSSSGGATG